VRFIDTEATEAAADGVIAVDRFSPGARLRVDRHVERYET
jgi:predicted glycosyltransferase